MCDIDITDDFWERIDAVTTRGGVIASTIRASIWKNGARNVLLNITDGIGYEGIIECWELRDRPEDLPR